jgi:hypothetical protein
MPWLLGVLLPFMLEETELTLSGAEFEGGVKRFPTLTEAELDCMPFRFGSWWNRWLLVNWRFDGGGSSKLGRLAVACRLAVRLEGAFRASRDVGIPIDGTATVAMLE